KNPLDEPTQRHPRKPPPVAPSPPPPAGGEGRGEGAFSRIGPVFQPNRECAPGLFLYSRELPFLLRNLAPQLAQLRILFIGREQQRRHGHDLAEIDRLA